MASFEPRADFNFLPGRFVGVLPSLEQAELDRFTSPGVQPENIRQALIGLLPHLGDKLVAMGRCRFPEGGRCRLEAFSGKGLEGFVVVTGQGQVLVGQTDPLRLGEARQLQDFLPADHEILSITVTDRHRLLGNRLDLYIVTRGFQEAAADPEKVQVYHGLIDLDSQGVPRLEIVTDDGSGEQRPSHWQPVDGDRFPNWLRSWRFGSAAGVDPFDPALDLLAAPLPYGDLEVEAVFLAPPWIGIGRAGELCLRRLDQAPSQAPEPTACRVLGQEVGFLSLARSTKNRVLAVARGDTRHLVGVCAGATDVVPEVEWRQLQPSLPADAAFLDRDAGDTAGWPDLLVVYEDGSIEHLRHLRPGTLRDIWESLWGQFEKSDLDAKFETAQDSSEEPLQWRRVALFAAVEGVLEILPGSSESQRNAWLQTLEDLFAEDQDHQLLLIGLEPILQCLRKSAAQALGNDSRLSFAFAVDLLHRIYHRQRLANVEVLSRIDWVVRSAKWLGDPSRLSKVTQQRFGELEQRSRVHLRNVVEDLEGRRNPSEVVRRCASNIERWSSVLTMMDTIWLGRPRGGEPSPEYLLTAVATFQTEGSQGETQGWLAVACRGFLEIHALDHDGRIELHPSASMEVSGNPQVIRIPGERSDRLLLVDGVGVARLLRWDGSEIHTQQDCDWGGGPGTPGPIQVLERKDGTYLVALTRSRGRASILGLLHIEDGELKPRRADFIDMHQISCLDLAQGTDQEILLLVASSLGGIVKLFSDPAGDGSFQAMGRYRPAGGVSLAACFESKHQPSRCLVGDNNGLLWCGNLQAPNHAGRLDWMYRFDAAVRSILALDINGERHFLSGSESGKLALIRSQGARRIWTDRMLSPVRQLVGFGDILGGIGLVAMQGGWLTTFCVETERDATLEAVHRDLETLGTRENGSSLWRSPDAKTVDAFCQIAALQAGPPPKNPPETSRDLATVVRGISGRERRARVLRFLSEVVNPPAQQDCVAVLDELTFRDLYRLLSYLPEDESSVLCETQVLGRLQTRSVSEELGNEDSQEYAIRAQVAAVQRLGRRAPSKIEEVFSVVPRDQQRLEDRWLRIELSRVLLQTLVRQHSQGPERRLLPLALPHLLRLPESMVRICADVLEDGKDDAEDFFAFDRLVQDLVKVGHVDPRDLERLQMRLEDLETLDPAVRLLAAIGALMLGFQQLQQELDEGEEDRTLLFQEARPELLAQLTALLALVAPSNPSRQEIAEPQRPDTWLARGIRKRLPHAGIPEDTARHDERLQWWGTFHQELAGGDDFSEDEERPFQFDGAWSHAAKACLRSVRKVLKRIVELEIRHIREEVRAFVETAAPIEIDTNRRVYLRLRLLPEGRTALNDVSIRIDVSTDGGLLPPSPDTLFRIERYPEFHGGSEPLAVDFQGYARRDSDTVTVRVMLESGDGYRHAQHWVFPLPEPMAQIETLSLSGPFRYAVDWALKRTLASKAGVVLAVVDQVLGREPFVHGWARATQGRLIDLDATLREVGQDRTYSARPLCLEDFEEALGLIDNDVSSEPSLVTSTSETIQRLLDGEAPGLLQQWVAWLHQRAQRSEDSPLVLLVSSTHVCFLRSHGQTSIPEIRAHRALLEGKQGNLLPRTRELRELTSAVASTSQISQDEALEKVTLLGGDLYLIGRWLLWLGEAPGRATHDLKEALEIRELKARIHAELVTLSAFDLLVALVGALAETNVPLAQAKVGLFAAQNYQSTTYRSQPKEIQRASQPLTLRSIRSLESDARRPESLVIEGFGTLGTANAPGTNLLGLTRRGGASLRKSFDRLQDLGIGVWFQKVFRTSEPYRSHIREIYRSLAGTAIEKRDGEVYKVLFGGDRSPLESLSLLEMENLPTAQLKSLLPGAEEEGLKSLPELLRLWQDKEPTEQNLVALFRKIYSKREVLPLSRDKRRWDKPLADLPFPRFGVGQGLADEETGESYPVGYHFWVERGKTIEVERFAKAIESTQKKLAKTRNQGKKEPKGSLWSPSTSPSWTPRVVLMGPGVEDRAPDLERRVAFLSQEDFCQALAEGDWGEELLRTARTQLKLTAISPFQTSGPIPPGSPFFFGRHEEMQFIEANLRKASILIVGSRRVGKTSMLNRARFWALQQPDLEPIYVDLQRVGSLADFHRSLQAAWKIHVQSRSDDLPLGKVTSIRDLAFEVRSRGRLPIFLFNEIDGLSPYESVIGEWRALNEEGAARFIMVAYSTVGELGKVDGPFFHFTVGTSFGGRAIAPTALSPEAAEGLIGVLTGDELGLRWASPEVEKNALRKLLERSYRIPWVLQLFGQKLLQRLENERRGVLTRADVDALLLEDGDVVWRFIESIDYESLSLEKPRGARPGYQLVLYSLARWQYFLGPEPLIEDPRLANRPSSKEGLGFSADKALEVVKETVAELLEGTERETVFQYYDHLKLEDALRLLTLTLTLEVDPKDGSRYGFLMHILPRELRRKYGAHKDPTLDGLIVETAIRLLRALN